MQTRMSSCLPVAGFPPVRKIALGSAMASLGGVTIVLSLLLGWNELARPWSFLVGLGSGLLGGAGVALALSGLIQCGRQSRARTDEEGGSDTGRSGGQTS